MNPTADPPQLLRYTADREAVALIVRVLRVQVVAVEVEAVSVRCGVGGRRPEVAFAADIDDGTLKVAVVAGERQGALVFFRVTLL